MLREFPIVEYFRDGFTVSTDKSRLDIAAIHLYLANESYPEDETIIKNEAAVSISIIEAKAQSGSQVEIEGVVSAEPGVLGTQFFYLSDASSGIRVYNYKKDFPVLKEGDLLRARGEIAELRGETTLKIADAEALKILASGSALKALEISSEEIISENTGRLLKIKGKVLKKIPLAFF
jgi:hypothetical protein